MRWSIGSHAHSLTDLLRRAGYALHRDRNSNQQSFVRHLGVGEFPRFHLYAKEESGDIILNLHIDQKQPSYGGSRAHAGEYEGSLLENERAHIQGITSRLNEESR